MDEKELIVKAGKALPLSKKGPAPGKVLGDEDLSDIFGLDMAESIASEAPRPKKKAVAKASKKKSAKRKVTPADELRGGSTRP